MEYNKQLFKKTNDKKILHKVRKHWVVVSMALLGAVGATGLVKDNVSANQTNTNYQNNHSTNINALDATQRQKSSLVSDQANPGELHNRINKSINSLQSSNTDNRAFSKSVSNVANTLKARIVSNIKSSKSQENNSRVIRNTQSVNNPNSNSLLSVNHNQVKTAIQQTKHMNQIQQNVRQSLKKLDSEPEVSSPNELGEDPQQTVNNIVSNINSINSQISASSGTISGYINQAKSASTLAHAQLSRYSDIDPNSVNSNAYDDKYGETSDYAFSDSSDAANQADKALNSDLDTMPVSGAVMDSIKASFVGSFASNVADNVYDEATAQQYIGSLENAENEVQNEYNSLASDINSASSMASDANNQANSVSNDFSSVSSAADSAAKAIAHMPATTTPEYDVVNVSTPQELFNAIWNTSVHQINIDRSISLWGLQNTDPHKETFVDLGDNADNNYQDVQSRNLNFNGLSNNGTRNTVDFGDYNFNLNASAIANKLTKLNVSDINMYGTSYWGPISSNNAAVWAISEYHNINYVGSQLVYDAGTDYPDIADTIFSGKDNVLTGAAYSPTGMYRHYDYKVPGNLSPYPGIIRDGIETDTDDNEIIDQGSESSKPEMYTGNDKINSTTHNVYLKHNTLIADYPNTASLNGGTFPTQSQTPDLAISWSSPDTWLDGWYFNTAQEALDAGIDAVDDQQLLQVATGNNVTFKPGSEFNGSTTDGHCIALGGSSSGSTSSVILQKNSNVNLIPRGNGSEQIASDGTSSGGGVLPSGIYINGSGNVHVGDGAKLNITPMTDTDCFNFTPDGTDSFSKNLKNYAPAAITAYNGGTINVLNGGSIDIEYPKSYNYSLPDSNLNSVTDNNGPQPYGALSMNGTNTAVHVYPYGSLIINGGGPINKANAYNPTPNNTDPGNLVYFGNPSITGNSANNIIADEHSDVRLKCGGSQKVLLFSGNNGTPVVVTDPKRFSLNLNENTNKDSQLASTGTSIQGNNVTAYDDHVDEATNQYTHSFGQYNQITFPGATKKVPNYVMNQIFQTVDQINKTMNAHPEYDQSSTPWSTIWNDLSPVINNSIYPDIKNSTYNDAADVLGLAYQAHLIPYGYSVLGNDNETYVKKFNNSIDLPYIIADSMINWIEGKYSSYNHGQTPANSPSINLGIDSRQFGDKIARVINKDVDSYYGYERENMTYNGKSIPIHKNGFNLTKGFAFEGVPHSTLEGIKIKNAQGNVVTDGHVQIGDTISGYAYPGSYIRLSEGNEYNQSTGDDTRNSNEQPITQGLNTLNDSNYTSDDPYFDDYIARANGKFGYWKFTIPSSDNKLTNLLNEGNLVITAHTATVANQNAARNAADYNNFRNYVLNGGNGIKKDTIDNADTYYRNINNFPSPTYPGHNYGLNYNEYSNNSYITDPANHPDDPTYTDDDDAGDITYDYSNVTDPSKPNEIISSFKHYTYNGTGTINDNDRNSYQTDDDNAGQYFEAGRLKGDHDIDNAQTDDSIYKMPYPFIIGYLTARGQQLNPNNINDDIDKALKLVKDIHHTVFTDYLPWIYQDGVNARKDLAAIGKTVSTLYSLIDYKDIQSANPYSYYPYSNLQSLADSVSPDAMSASGYEYSEYSYNSQTYNGSNSNNDYLYSEVANIDGSLNGAIQILNGYRRAVNGDATTYSNYYSEASSAAKTGEADAKQLDLLKAKVIYSEAYTYDSSANSVSSSAESENSSASYDNIAASSDSNKVKTSVSSVRTPTSNSEASDFNSVADSYADSANYDAKVINRDYREVNHRYHQLSLANHVFASDSAEINSLSSSVSNELKAGNLKDSSLSDANSASSAINSASAELSNASSTYNSAMSNFASSGYTSESNARTEISNLSSILGSEGYQTSVENSIQSMDISSDDFDGASDVNIGFNNSGSGTDPETSENYSGNSKPTKTYQNKGVFYSLLDKFNDTLARNDMSAAASAQARVRSLSYKLHDETGVARMMPTLVRIIMLGASPDASHGVVPSRNGNDANHAGKAQNNNSVQTSNIKVISVKKDANGNVIDSESQNFPVKRPIGSNYVVDPQDYAPAGYHAVNDQIVNDPMTSNGLDKKQIVFNYQTNDSNSNDTSHTSQGVVNINYVNSTNNEVVHTEPIHGNLGKPFNLSQYDGHLPSGYRFNSVTDGMNINTFMNQPQNVTVKVTPIGSQQSSASHNVPNTPARPQSSSAGNDYVPSYPQLSSNNSAMNNLPNASSSNQTSYSQPNSDANNSAVDEARSAASDGQVNFWDNLNSADNNSLIPQSNSADNSASDSTNGNSAVKSSASSSNPSSQKSANAGSMNSDSIDGNNSANNDDPDENDNTNNGSSDSHVNRTGTGSKSSIGNNDGSSVTRPSHSYVNGVKDALSSNPAKRDSSGYMKGYMDQKRYNDSDSQDLPQTGEVDYAKLAVALLLIASATGLDGLIDRRHSKE